METLETLRRKILGARELLSVVKTMKALAAVNIRQVEKAVKSLTEYDRTVHLALQMVLYRVPEVLAPLAPVRSGRSLAVVLGSDQGLAGRFNDLVTAFARDQMNQPEASAHPWTVWAVGLRAQTRLERLGYRVDELFEVPSSVNGIQSAVQDLLQRIEAWRSPGRNDRVFLAYNRQASGAVIQPRRIQLWPLNREWLRSFARKKWPSRGLPSFTMDPGPLLSALVRQFLSTTLYRTIAESLAAENASRLAAMQAAEKNISERLDELQAVFHQQRQSAITEELMDVIAGFETLSADNRPQKEDRADPGGSPDKTHRRKRTGERAAPSALPFP